MKHSFGAACANHPFPFIFFFILPICHRPSLRHTIILVFPHSFPNFPSIILFFFVEKSCFPLPVHNPSLLFCSTQHCFAFVKQCPTNQKKAKTNKNKVFARKFMYAIENNIINIRQFDKQKLQRDFEVRDAVGGTSENMCTSKNVRRNVLVRRRKVLQLSSEPQHFLREGCFHPHHLRNTLRCQFVLSCFASPKKEKKC